MSQEKKQKKSLFNKTKKANTSTKKKKLDAASWIIIVGCVIIAIPVLIFGWILMSAALNTGKPIHGDRFKNDLDPAITSEQISQINTAVKSIQNAEEVEVLLKVATLRIYIDTTDSMTPEIAEEIGNEAYNKILEVLDQQTYFTSNGTKKMYDIEVHVYNYSAEQDRESDQFVYVITSKSSTMDKSISRLVSEPLDPELAAQILDELDRKRNPSKYENEDEDIVNPGHDNEDDVVDGDE